MTLSNASVVLHYYSLHWEKCLLSTVITNQTSLDNIYFLGQLGLWVVVGEALYIYSNYALYNKGKIHNTYYTLFFFFGSVRSSRIANLRSSFCLSNEKCYRGHNIHLSISGQSQVILRPFSNLSQVSLSLLLQTDGT